MDEKDIETKSPADNGKKDCKYNYPPIDLLKTYAPDKKAAEENVRNQESHKEIILCILKNAGIEAEITDIKYGTAVTRFELTVPYGTSLKRVNETYDDLNLWLVPRRNIRMVVLFPLPYIWIEVPNKSSLTVGLREMMESGVFKNRGTNSLCFCLGKDVAGSPVIFDFRKMPHLLIAGATGTGKTMFLNTMIVSLLYKHSPEDLRIVIADSDLIEFTAFRGIPNLMFDEIFGSADEVCSMLGWAEKEMNERYKKISGAQVKDIDGYNAYMAETHGKKMPRILIIIDGFTGFTVNTGKKKHIKTAIAHIAAKSRPTGIHMVMTAQYISPEDADDYAIKNFSSRIAFKMEDPDEDSAFMDGAGAEKLIGMGDLLYRAWTMSGTERARGCFISTEETERICNYLRDHNECHYDELALKKIEGGI